MTCWYTPHAESQRSPGAAPLACLWNVMRVGQAAAGPGSGGHTTETTYTARKSCWARHVGNMLVGACQ